MSTITFPAAGRVSAGRTFSGACW